MGYFNELPNLEYLSQLPDADTNETYITVKNLFKRAKIRDDIINVITSFVYYQIEDNERPDVVASKIYDNSELDWVVLITNNITNIREQWPLSNQDLYNYMIDKYGSDENISEIHHHETTEVRDEYDRLVLPAKLKIDQNFTITYSKLDNAIVTVSPVKSISNYEYEIDINEKKRQIRVLRPSYLSVIISDLRNSMKYDISSDYISKTSKKTYNPNLTGV